MLIEVGGVAVSTIRCGLRYADRCARGTELTSAAIALLLLLAATASAGRCHADSSNHAPTFRVDGVGERVPTIVGIGLKSGELGFEPRSTSTGQAVTIARRYQNGDPMHVIAAGAFPTGRNIMLSEKAPQRASLAPQDIAQRRPKAAVSYAGEVVELAELLNSPHEIPLSSPTMVEAIYRGPIVTDGVQATFQVRLYDSDDVWIRVWVQRPHPNRGVSKDKTGAHKPLKVTIGDVVVADTQRFPLYKNSSFDWERYLGGNQYSHTVWHDTARLQETGLIPHYGWIRSVPDEQLSSLTQQYKPGRLGDYKKGMATAGVTSELGPVPGWVARWLGAGGDPRAWRAIIANTRSAGAYPITWRNKDGWILKPSDSPSIAYNGKNGNGASTLTNGPFQFDGAHNPEIGYVAYLITGDTYFRDLMLGNVAALYMLSKVNGEGVHKRSQQQTRQTAWTLRAIGNAARILPENHPSLSDLRAWLWTQYRTMLAAGPDNEKIDETFALGIPWAKAGNRSESIHQKPWMFNFWAWAAAYIARTDALRDDKKTEAQRFARWMLQSVTGQLGGANGKCPANAAAYSLKYSDQPNPYHGKIHTAEVLYKDWPTLFRANGLDKSCPNQLLGNKATGPKSVNSHWAQMMPAIAEAFEYEMPGIRERWDRVRAASNYASDIYRKNWSWGGWGVTGKGQAITPLSRQKKRSSQPMRGQQDRPVRSSSGLPPAPQWKDSPGR